MGGEFGMKRKRGKVTLKEEWRLKSIKKDSLFVSSLL
jgi:hypothetical protein